MASTTIFANTSDGRIASVNADYATARAGGALNSFPGSTTLMAGQTFDGSTYTVIASFLNFDVSSIPAADVIKAVSFELFLTTSAIASTDFTIEARSQNWGDTLENADWVPGADLASKTLLASIDTSGIGSTGAYKALTSQSAFLTVVEDARDGDGIVRLMICSSRTTDNLAPTDDERLFFSAADEAGTTQDPMLVIEHEPFVAPDPFYEPATYTLLARSSQTLSVLAHITDFDQATWAHRLYELGDFAIERVELDDTLLDWVADEGVLEVVRNGTSEYLGLVDDVVFDDETGLATVKGRDLRQFLEWRDIYPPTGEEVDSQSGTASQVIRNYILANLTTGASSARNINNQFTPSLNVQSVSIGNTVDRHERYSNLLSKAMEIAQEGEIYFVPAIVSGNYQINFSVYTDKTATVRLTLPLGTALRMGLTLSRRDYINAVRTIWNANSDDELVVDDDDIVSTLSPYRRERVVTSSVKLSATLTLSNPMQWWTDFSEYPETSSTSDPGPPGWTRRWDEAAMQVNVTSTGLPSGSTGGVALRMLERSPASEDSRFALSSDYPGIVSTPVEIHTRARFTVTENNGITAVLHGGGSGNLNEDTYQLSLHGTTLEWSLAKLLVGTGSALSIESTPAINANTWYRMRLRREGRNVLAKVWADGGAEPGTWITVEDNSHDSGWMGLSRWAVTGGGTGTTWFDWVGFAWGGGTAPNTMADQTVTIGAKTYTFGHDMTVANAVRREVTGELMVRNLVAAINGDAGAGELYGTGTTAHSDVTAEQDGSRLIVTSDGTATVALSSNLENGDWNADELGATADLASVLLTESAERVRTYSVELNQRAVPYRSSIQMGDLVTVLSERLSITDSKFVAGVDVAYSQGTGERVTVQLGVPPPVLWDALGTHTKEIRSLKTR